MGKEKDIRHNHTEGSGPHSMADVFRYRNEICSMVLLALGMVLDWTGVFSDLAGRLGVTSASIEIPYYILSVLPVGMPILLSTFKLWKRLDFFNEFTLMLLAAVGAFIIGEYPEGVAILLFYSFGEKLEDSASDKARHRITSLLDKMPKEVTVESMDGIRMKVEPENVEPGTMFIVRPGERVALDGVLCGDSADFDSSAVTGESVPVSVASGAEVSSGFIPVDKEVHLRSTARYSDSTMSRIMSMVEESSAKKSTTETLLRKITRWYTPVVMLAAALLFVIPWIISVFSAGFDFEWYVWFERALVLLVCSCPCALVVSIPLSYFVALGNASRFGMLFKGSRYLDALRGIKVLLLDKTGTLTTGKFHVSDVVVSAPGSTREHVVAMAAAMDVQSAHPLARAIVQYAGDHNVIMPEAVDVVAVNHGLKGVVAGRTVLVGSRKLLADNGISVPNIESASSEVCVAVDDVYCGSILLDDVVKPGVASTLARLRRFGVAKIEILSGDREGAVAKVAASVGADSYRAALLPQDKHRIVEELESEGGTVAFVGDGINDAPSLALADIGIAIGTGGSDVAMESADAVIMGNNLDRLTDAFDISRRIKRVVTENVALAIGVKLLVMILGAFGIASLWAAVFADTGITLVTVGWTLFCLRTKRGKK